MRLWSEDFKEGERIPRQFTCNGENINPQIRWDDIPPGTRSLALIMDDPDAPRGTFTHWAVKNIPPNVRSIERNSLPNGAEQLMNDFRKIGYGGPCPPGETHRFVLKLYALDEGNVKSEDERSLRREIKKHKISRATLTGTYGR
jgi:Raf kinase inhibitor-like YbhB/YbcL family protein